MSYFEVLPDELVLHIFSKFHAIKDLKNASITCDKFCGIFSNLPSEFWRSVLAEQWYLNETELAYMPDKDWKEVVKTLVRSEQEILDDKSLEGETLRTLVTYLRSTTLVADLLEVNSAAENLLKQAMINLRKDYVLDVVGSTRVARLLRLNVPQLLVSLLGVIPRVTALSSLTEETVLSVYELFGNKQVTRESIPYGILTNLRKHIEHESSLHVQRITFVYWSLAELETLLPLFLKLGYIPLLSNLLAQHDDKEIQQSVLGFLTWFQKTGNFDVEVDKSKNLVPKMLDIFAAPDNGNMELRETASRAIRTTIGYEGGTKALKTFIECNGIERSLDLLAKISGQAASDAKEVTNHKVVPTHVSIVVEVIVTLHCCISFISSDHMRTNLIHESVQRLEPYFDALIQYISFPHPVVRKKAIDFWMSCMCAKIPAPEVNKKIMTALVNMVKTETAFKMRIRYFSLAANIAVTDDSVFCSEDARTLGEVWIEGFLSEDMHKLEGDSRWLLYLIPGSLFQFEEFQKITAAKPQAVAKMKQFASAENADLVNRFRATLALSYMYQTGTLDASVLPLINDFAMQVPHTVAWRLVFSKVKPYWHLFPSQRVELLALVAWLLAHTSLTEIGKVAINTELDWSVVTRLEAIDNPRIRELLKIFRHNMNKLSSYFTIWESSGK
jgi:hypothetical protein